MKEFKVENHESSLLPDGEWKLVWADEFDGTELDRTKWLFRLVWDQCFDLLLIGYHLTEKVMLFFVDS